MKQILVKPVITEKTLQSADKLNQYTFVVASNSGKIEVSQAVAAKFDVTVEKVRIINTIGKTLHSLNNFR